jgi:hypothetical protein
VTEITTTSAIVVDNDVASSLRAGQRLRPKENSQMGRRALSPAVTKGLVNVPDGPARDSLLYRNAR